MRAKKVTEPPSRRLPTRVEVRCAVSSAKFVKVAATITQSNGDR